MKSDSDFSTSTSEILPFALAAAAADLSVVPPRMDGSKAPIGTWKNYQHFPPDEAQLRRWYAAQGLTGIGVVTGKVSGNLEVLEFDDRLTYEAFKSAADAAGLGDLVNRIEAGYCEASPKPGIHYLYRCSQIAGNTKLATRPKAPEEMKHPRDKEQVLIETRGEGGYIVTAPSNGKTHPSGGCYSLLSGGFDSIATITPEERSDLWALAKMFHVAPAATAEQAEKENIGNHRPHASKGWIIRPGDDFNARAVWAELLEAQGWTFVFKQGERDYWRRPGKNQGVSACTNWDGKDYFYCFTTSTEFDAEKPIDKFGFHALTCYGGDFKATVKALARAGYGRADEQQQARQGKAKATPEPERADRDTPIKMHPDYEMNPGGTFWIKHLEGGDVFVLLANFIAEIIAETVIDDGAERKRRMEISGSAADQVFPVTTIPSGQFGMMNWVGENWGSAAQIAPGMGLKDRLRYAIQVLSGNVQHRTVYEHTGWRQLNGSGWQYLFNGGAIGSEGFSDRYAVELPGTLTDYRLTTGGADAIRASLRLLDVAPLAIAAPLFAAPYAAILGEALIVDWSLFCAGTTGTRKTEVAAIVQNHFGPDWRGKHLPASWSSSGNSLERTAFLAKDTVLTIDDFCPHGTTADVARYHSSADRVLRAQGNRAGRGRMNADGSLRPTYFPRGLIVATGEDIPRGQSLRGRLLVLEFAPNTVNLSVLSELQIAAANGELSAATGLFIQWLAPQIDELKRTLPQQRIALRNEIVLRDGHSRHPDTLAGILVALMVFERFAAAQGIQLPADWIANLTEALMQTGNDQAAHQVSEEPAARFIMLIYAALSAGLCHVKRRDEREPYATETEMAGLGWQLKTFGIGEHERTDWHPQGATVGWFDDMGLYLEPDAAYRTVQQFATAQGNGLSLSKNALQKALDEKGKLLTKHDGRTTASLRMGGDKNKTRVLHIARGGEGVNTGSNGSNGSNRTQQHENQNENGVTGSGSKESVAVPTVPTSPNLGTAFPDSGTAEKNERFQNLAPNPLTNNGIYDSGTVGTVGTAFGDNPPPRVPFAESADDLSSHQPAPNPLDTRILAALTGSPAGFSSAELHRQVGNDKGTSLAMLEAALLRLVKAGDVAKVNGKWVSEVAK